MVTVQVSKIINSVLLVTVVEVSDSCLSTPINLVKLEYCVVLEYQFSVLVEKLVEQMYMLTHAHMTMTAILDLQDSTH